MLPNDSKLYIKDDKKEFLYLDTTLYDPKVYYERGGLDVSDPSLGLFYQSWYLRYSNKQFILRSEDGKEYILKTLTSDIDLSKISFSFDQNMKLAWGYTERDTNSSTFKTYFLWYDSTINNYREVILPDCRDISIKLDDPRESSNTFNDIVLLYIDKEEWLTVSYQRDRYLKNKKLIKIPKYSVITKIGLTKDYRFQIELRSTKEVKHRNNKFILEDI